MVSRTTRKPYNPDEFADHVAAKLPALLDLVPQLENPLSQTLHPPLTASRLKVTVVLNAAELLTVPAPEGKPRVTLRIALPSRTVTADIAAKSLRKTQTVIREAGADNVAVILQGHLIAGDVIAEAGLTAQSKIAKPT
jgi:hypothetical protein